MGKIFGTDGIRGKANLYPMTPELAMKLGKAIAVIFRNQKRKNGRNPCFLIGKDTRLSGYMFENALTAGLVSKGADVILVGPMPTPAIAHLTKSMDANAGLVISASHNPAEDNGIKIFAADGIKLPDEIEERIEQYLFSDHDDEEPITGARIGRATRIQDARGRYIEFAKNTINNESLEGIKIILDCANGAAYSVSPFIFQELGAEVIVINSTPNGTNINHNCGALYPELIQKEVINHSANIGIAVDGDADRVVFVDETGAVIDGDTILAIAAIDMKKQGILFNNTLVATEYSTLALDKTLNKEGINVVRVKNGDRYVIEEMIKNGYNLGGEKTGHIIFGNESKTGDGTVAALKIIEIIKRTNKSLSELAKCLEPYPHVQINIKVKEKRELEKMPRVLEAIKNIETQLGKEGRTLIRYSGTENLLRIMVEGIDKKKISKLAEELAKEIQKEIGV